MRLRFALLFSLTLAAGFPLRSQSPGIGAMQSANTIGVFRQNPPPPGLSVGLTDWVVDSDGAHVFELNDAIFWFGLNGDLPIMGDWNDSQHLQLGIFRDGYWYVDSNDNKVWDSADQIYVWGWAEDIPVVGDWDLTGRVRMGVFRIVGGQAFWYVDMYSCTEHLGCNWGGP